MEDFNRVSFVTRNFKLLNGLILIPFALIYVGQALTTLGFSFFSNLFLIITLFVFMAAALLSGVMNQFYKKRFGTVTSYKPKNSFGKGFAAYLVSMAVLLGSLIISVKLTSFLAGLLFVGLLTFMPNFKENWTYRKHNFALAAVVFLLNFIPLENLINFRFDAAMLNFKSALLLMIFLGIPGIFDHFLLLRQMRPFRAESIKNSQVSQDSILGDPANLTILAVLSNCQSADFVFLRKMSHLEETEFYRRITGLQEAGLVFIHEQPHGILSKVRAATITQLGWQIVNRIYNEVGPTGAPPRALVHA